jgi:hypothetical protein
MPETAGKVCNPIPMAKWLEEEKEGECRPCSLAVAVPRYQEVLQEAGLDGESDKLAVALQDEEDPVMKVAEAMDAVKEAVSDEVREELKSVDCMAQNSQQEVPDGNLS